MTPLSPPPPQKKLLSESPALLGLNCKNYGVNDVVISSILVKKNPNLNVLIRRENDLLRELCRINGFGYICDDTIITVFLERWNSFAKFAHKCFKF